MRRFNKGLLASATALAMGWSCVCAAQGPSETWNIEAQDLKQSLRNLARTAGLDIVAPSDLVAGKQAHAVRGQFTVEQALARLVDGTGLSAAISEGTIYIRGRSDTLVEGSTEPSQNTAEMIVTGSRIRGARPASPVITLSSDQIRLAGQPDLGEAIRALPQNFNGGQNPGVASGVIGLSNQNVSSASSINLRGLGPDATLTLLNGHRLAYGSFVQSIDVDAIPLAAVDRVEIVADGASALYGSDAVGGVANIILKKNYEGLTASARLGAATQGGDQQQQYGLVSGAKWASGNVLVALDYANDTAILARQRSYTGYMPDDGTLLPSQNRHSGLISGRQVLAPSLEFSIDATYNRRRSQNTLIAPAIARYDMRRLNTSFVIAPSLALEVTPALSLSLTGVYGRDESKTRQETRLPSTTTVTQSGYCYCNDIRSIEAGAEGSLFQLPAGLARFAIGGGFRSNGFVNSRVNATTVVDARRNSSYGFGELSVPIVSPDMGLALLRSLNLSGALRYENYPSIGDVLTPKIGIIAAPTENFDLKGSWGRSFKAPTLSQQYQGTYVYLYRAATLGGSGLPPTATAIFYQGGNANLKPEKAETWSGTLALHPRALPGARFEVSYFDVTYRNRVTQPIQGTNVFSSLSDSRYQNFITPGPSAAAQAAIIANGVVGLSNQAGTAYVPANVVALIQGSYLNAATQRYRGLDVSARYRLDLGAMRSVTLSADGSKLRSREQLNAAVPARQLAGTIFNAPKLRARFGAVWSDAGFDIAAFGNFIGGVTDNRTLSPVEVDHQLTADLSLHYRVNSAGPLGAIDLGVAVRNVFDDRPAYAAPAATYYVNYDSTNQSAIGRFVSVSLTSRW